MQKHQRLEQDVKVALSNIVMYDVKNISSMPVISVTDVKITPDQKYAKVYISIFGKKNKDEVIDGLKKAKGFIKGELGKKVRLRNVPEITFLLDNSIEYGSYMDQVISDVIKKDAEIAAENIATEDIQEDTKIEE